MIGYEAVRRGEQERDKKENKHREQDIQRRALSNEWTKLQAAIKYSWQVGRYIEGKKSLNKLPG